MVQGRPKTLLLRTDGERGFVFCGQGKAHWKDFAFLMVQGGIYGKNAGNISTTFCKENASVPAQPF